jgi:hypothetical protein
MPRAITSSSQPPYQPATEPRNTPTASDRLTVAAPTASESRAPATRRARTSRPRASCPSRCAALGGRKRADRSVLNGSKGTSTGAAIAARATSASTALPTSAARTARDSLCIAKARIERGQQEIGAGVHHDVGDPEDEGAALHQRIVARADRLDDEPARSRATRRSSPSRPRRRAAHQAATP